MNKDEAARHVMGGETSGTHAFIQAPGWPLEMNVCLSWRIYYPEPDQKIHFESQVNLLRKENKSR